MMQNEKHKIAIYMKATKRNKSIKREASYKYKEKNKREKRLHHIRGNNCKH